MAQEQTYETFISVRENIEYLAAILGEPLQESEAPEGPVRFTTVDSHPVGFTLFSYRDRPTYSHLLSSQPVDPECVALFLSQLGVCEDMIDVAVDIESNTPMQDIDAICESVAKLRATSRH